MHIFVYYNVLYIFEVVGRMTAKLTAFYPLVKVQGDVDGFCVSV